MRSKIQHRINNSDILLTDTTTNQYVKIDHEMFEEMWREYRDRLIDKKYRGKAAITGRKKLHNKDFDEMGPKMMKLIEQELIPDFSYKINESMAKENWELSIPIWCVLLGNFISLATKGLLSIYPEEAHPMLGYEVGFNLNKIISGHLMGSDEGIVNKYHPPE
jgi:hypothetical protein